MKRQEYAWHDEFIRCLRLGTVDARLSEYFDAISILVKQVDSEASPLKELVDEHSLEWVLQRYEEFLDRLFISDLSVANPFPIGMSPDQAKVRFRQLMRVFHPDRGVHEEAWLNFRAERINIAFKKFESNARTSKAAHLDLNIKANKAVANPVSSATKNQKLKPSIKYKPNAMRAILGSADQVQKRIVIGLCISAAVLIFLVFLSSSEPPKRVVKVDNVDVEVDRLRSANISTEVRGDGVNGDVDQSSSLIQVDESVAQILSEAPWLSEEIELDAFDQAEIERKFQEQEIEEGSVNFSSFDTGLSDSISMKNVEAQGTRADVRHVKPLDQQSGSNIKPSREGVLVNRVNDPVHQIKRNLSSNIASQKRKDAQNKFSELTPCSFSIGERSPTISPHMEVRGKASLRKGPSLDCAVVVELETGQIVEVLQRVLQKEGQWYKVISKDSNQALKQGWVFGELLKPVKEVLLAVDGEKSDSQSSKSDRLTVKVDASEKSLNAAVNVLKRLETAFEAGDVQLLAAQYAFNGRENNIKGISRLAKAYKSLFSNTYARTLKYKIESHNVERLPGEIQLKGRVEFSYKNISNDKETSVVGRTMFRLVEVGDAYKVLSYEWEEIAQ